jgi:hypothetical protein
MTTHRRIVTLDEQDAYTPWRRCYPSLQKAGAVREIKVRTHRRERREGHDEIDAQLRDLP